MLLGLYMVESVFAQSVPNSDIIFYQDFDHRPLGNYGATELAEDWLGAGSPAANKQQLSITDGKWAYSGKALRVRYPKNLSNDANVQWQSDFGQIYDELFMSYRIRFGDNMDFVSGGKLPGLYGGDSPTGGDKASGYFGFSSRFMWRSNSGGFSFPAGKTALVAYCYYVKPFNPWDTSASDDVSMSGVYTPGRWYQIEMRLKMNTATAVKDDYEEDGELEIWVDGVQVAFRNDLVWRKFVKNWAIDGLLFSTFFGGSGFSWAPKTKDEYILRFW